MERVSTLAMQAKTDRSVIPELWTEVERFIGQICKRYCRPGAGTRLYDYDDLIQCSYFGFLKAIDTYDESRGAFSTYLAYFIRRACRREIRQDGRQSDPLCRADSLDAPLPHAEDDYSLADTLADPDAGEPFSIIERDMLVDTILAEADRLPHPNQGRVIREHTYLRNADIFEIVGHHGSYRGAGVGGGITGMGGEYIIIDDPIKNREEANSPAYRDKLWDWYTSTLYTRQEKNAGILITLTRWHEDDLAGRLLEAAKTSDGDKWEVIALPAIREDTICPYDTRLEGEALWADKYDIARLATIKATIGSYDWASLYQQHPSPGEGGLFKREWWRRWETIPGDLFDFLQSWDCTFKDSSSSDYVVGQVWARSESNPAHRYLLDQVRGRMTFTETLNAIRDLSAKWPRTERKLIEDKANGSAVIDMLTNEISGIIPVEPKGGKVVRANAVTANVEAGNVFLPAAPLAAWVGDLIEEFAAFPSGRHDDQVDAMTQANAWYNENNMNWEFEFSDSDNYMGSYTQDTGSWHRSG